MSKFPDPVVVPPEVINARKHRYRAVVKSATQGILIRGFIAVITLVAALIFNSAALFMDALSTAVDIISSAVLLFSFKLAARPPDDNHPFGHGRYEPLAGLQLGLFLFFLGGGMFFYNIFEINRVDPYTALPTYLWLIPFCSFILLEIAYRKMMTTAKKENSPALAADATHYRVDSVTSILATIALFLGSYSIEFSQMFDHIGAACIAIFMVILGAFASRRNMHQVLDGIPDLSYFEKVKNAAMKTPGVLGTEKIRMQLYGPDAHVDIDVEVDPALSVEKAHAISQQVRVEIQKEIPLARDVIVHIEPFYPNDHEDRR